MKKLWVVVFLKNKRWRDQCQFCFATLNPMKDAAKVWAINYRADFENLFGWFDAYTKFYNTGKTKNDIVRYIPGLTKPVHQGQIDRTLTK